MERVGSDATYPPQPSKLNLPAIEHQILDFWERDGTFAESIDRRRRQGKPAFVFYDGPPFANGLPHYGHLLTGFVKDAIPRYQTMAGKVVERRFGWDCHGLPAEMASEKELGLSGREEIESLGIDRFNDHCRGLVQRTTDEWFRYVTRQARWVDFVHSYKTMDTSFMESVIWAFKRLYERGFVYEHYRVLPYCWECETPLSNFETRQDDSYRVRTDPAITVAFHLPAVDGAAALDSDLYMLAWTTTPWTLPSNLALAVNPDAVYVLVQADRPYVIARERLEAYAEHLGSAPVVAEVRGADLVGRSFEPLFPFFAGEPNAFKVIAASFVTMDEGTGIVQMAPGFGEDDQLACEANGIGVVCPVDDRGRYTGEVPWYAGQQVFDANAAIVNYLRDSGALLEESNYEHSYPHCWRTDTPLIYKAVGSWFVDVTAIKKQLLAKNQEINWVPEHIKNGAFGKWLEGARDWSITRNRYWGAPIPVWKSDDPQYPRVDVYGSLAELAADFGVEPTDLHRPYIDELVRPNPDDPSGKSMMRRVTDVLDCWFESGSMPFAQLHYPFENKEQFEKTFPADFIVEFIGQTRGWFYTLHVLSVGLFDEPPFKHCMAHGVLLGDDGRKLSKRLKNYPDPWEVFEEIGADAMRWFLLSSSVLRGQEMVLERKAMFDTVKRVINPIWNAFSFLTLYAQADSSIGRMDATSTNLTDRYLLAKLGQLIDATTAAFDSYDLSKATQEIEAFLDALNNWYIRRSRDRFWSRRGQNALADTDKQAAYNTLHTTLVTLTQLVAPLLPMVSEMLFKALTGERSVHLTDWPTGKAINRDDQLVAEIETVREICSQIHSIRKQAGLRSRLPLRRVTIASANALALGDYQELIKAETNVKEVVFTTAFESYAHQRITLVPRLIGPRLGGEVQRVIRAVKDGDYRATETGVEVGGIPLLAGEYSTALEPTDPDRMRVLESHVAVVALDTAIDEELLLEGLARDLLRHIQKHRKLAGYEVTDRIVLELAGVAPNGKVAEALARNHREIADQALAHELIIDHEATKLDGFSDVFDAATEQITVTSRRSVQQAR